MTTKTIPPRPTLTEELIARGIDMFIAEHSEYSDIRDELNDCYFRLSTGLDIALELYKHHDIKSESVDELDAIDSFVGKALIAAEKAWAEENSIQPTLPAGTRIAQGVIAGVHEYGVARYKVSRDGDAEGSYLILKFEDAVEVKS